ncbi:MAG: hypothetical protein Q8O37_11205 [Sulfuricellaceae bacterium]|nr:hypothetical protein [Sulfuricellaceae bacterium]
MSDDAQHLLTYKLITCFLPAGGGKEVLDGLRKQKGMLSAYVHHARGAGVDARRASGKAPLYVEREVITVLAPAHQADDIFEYLYFAAGLDQPHAGMILMEKAIRGVACSLPPDLPEEI